MITKNVTGKYALPKLIEPFIALCTNLLSGLKKLGTVLDIKDVTASGFETELNSLIDGQAIYEGARSAKRAASAGLTPADEAIYDWLMLARNVFMKSFGTRWNTQWAQAGWTDHSTRIPKLIEVRRTRIKAVAMFLTAQPTYENGPLNITAKEANRLYDVAVAAGTAVAGAKTVQSTTKDTRAEKEEAMRTSARMLIDILKGKLAKDDPRWQEFGLEMPVTKTTPGRPVNVTAQLDATGAIMAQCDATPLATRYRWRMLIVGRETVYRLVARSVAPMALIEGAMPSDTVRIIVQAVNDDSQGVASEPIEFTIPLAEKSETVAPRAAVEEEVVLVETPAPAQDRVNGTNGHARRNGVVTV